MATHGAASLNDLLAQLNLSKYADSLHQQDVDIDAARQLSDADWVNLGVSIGARAKLKEALQETAPSKKREKRSSKKPDELRHRKEKSSSKSKSGTNSDMGSASVGERVTLTVDGAGDTCTVRPPQQLQPVGAVVPIARIRFSPQLCGHILGKGGFGTVYKGVLEGTPVAVKKLQLLLRDDQTDEFEREVRMLATLRHTHIVYLIGISITPEGEALLICEHMAGGSLLNRLYPSSTLTDEMRLTVALDVSRALAFLHTREPSVVHRDIKPANILIDADCKKACVADLGLARIMVHRGVSFAGTISHMAPELILRQGGGPAVDIYAVGLVLFEMWSGRPPYSWSTEEDYVRNAKSATPVAPRSASDMPKELATLAARCILRHSGDRPTAHELIASIEKVRKMGDYDVPLVPKTMNRESA